MRNSMPEAQKPNDVLLIYGEYISYLRFCIGTKHYAISKTKFNKEITSDQVITRSNYDSTK